MKGWAKKIEDKKAIVGILGLGYTGLPLAMQFIAAGLRVIGFDTNREKIKALDEGKSPISSISHDAIEKMKENGFEFTMDMYRLKEVDVILVCVPTPLVQKGEQKIPDLSHIYDGSRTIAKYLKRGQLVIIESTSYPGTTRDKIKPKLEENNKGLKAGEDFHLAYSPEREDPGNDEYSIRNTPKVVGGLTDKCCDMACKLFSIVITEVKEGKPGVVPVPSLEVAEASKILENVYRYINIALVNEIKMVFDKMEIDVWDVIEAAKTKPFGFMYFEPGIGVGGHCIAIDPFYMTWIAAQHGEDIKIIKAASEINDYMTHYVLEKIRKALHEVGKKLEASKILLLGITYKKDVNDLRESPSIELIKLLRQKGAEVDYHDPYFPEIVIKEEPYYSMMYSIELSPNTVAGSDAVVILVDHSKYQSEYDWIVKNAKLVIDTRNVISSVDEDCQHIVKA